MIIINSLSDNYFELNGTDYAKIYHPLKMGLNSVGIYNVYDTNQQLVNSTSYNEFTINGTSYNSQADVISALLPVIYKPFNTGDFSQTDWGAIQGNINNQGDLIALFNTKVDINDLGVVAFNNDYNSLDNLPSFSGYSTTENTASQLLANPSGATISLLNSDGDVLDSVDVGFLNNEGTTLEYSGASESIIIKNDEGEILSSIPVSSFLTGVGDNLFLSGVNLQLRDSSNAVLSSVELNISNINGLSAELSNLQDDIDLHSENTNNPHQVSFDDLISTGHTHSVSEIIDFPINVSDFNNDIGYLTGITESDVTQFESALTITESQISDLTHFSGDSITISGTPEANQITYFTSADSITGDENFIWDGAINTITGRQVINKPRTSTYTLVKSMYVPDMINNNYAEFILGKEEAYHNRASIAFNYVSDNNINNGLNVLFYGTPNILSIKASGAITAPEFDNSLIDSTGDDSLITKRYLDETLSNFSGNTSGSTTGILNQNQIAFGAADGSMTGSTDLVYSSDTLNINGDIFLTGVENGIYMRRADGGSAKLFYVDSNDSTIFNTIGGNDFQIRRNGDTKIALAAGGSDGFVEIKSALSVEGIDGIKLDAVGNSVTESPISRRWGMYANSTEQLCIGSRGGMKFEVGGGASGANLKTSFEILNNGNIQFNTGATIGVLGGQELTIGKISGGGDMTLNVDANTTWIKNLILNNGQGLLFGSTANSNQIRANTSEPFMFSKTGSGTVDYQFDTGVSDVQFMNVGNVGIGTESPSSKLHISGNTRVDGNILSNSFIKTDGTSDEILLGDGSVTSLSGLTTNPNNIYNSNGTISGSRLITVDGSIMYLGGSGNTSWLQNDTTGQIYALATDSIQLGTTGLANSITIDVSDGTTISGNVNVEDIINLGQYTYSALPTPSVGDLAFITDASSVSYRGLASGGGTDTAMVFFDGDKWIYH